MSWGETFLPQLLPGSAAAPAAAPAIAPPATTVRLGFSDGTELELAHGDEHFDHLVEVAGLLNGDRSGRGAG
jgi:hypothetical protein